MSMLSVARAGALAVALGGATAVTASTQAHALSAPASSQPAAPGDSQLNCQDGAEKWAASPGLQTREQPVAISDRVSVSCSADIGGNTIAATVVLTVQGTATASCAGSDSDVSGTITALGQADNVSGHLTLDNPAATTGATWKLTGTITSGPGTGATFSVTGPNDAAAAGQCGQGSGLAGGTGRIGQADISI